MWLSGGSITVGVCACRVLTAIPLLIPDIRMLTLFHAGSPKQVPEVSQLSFFRSSPQQGWSLLMVAHDKDDQQSAHSGWAREHLQVMWPHIKLQLTQDPFSPLASQTGAGFQLLHLRMHSIRIPREFRWLNPKPALWRQEILHNLFPLYRIYSVSRNLKLWPGVLESPRAAVSRERQDHKPGCFNTRI